MRKKNLLFITSLLFAKLISQTQGLDAMSGIEIKSPQSNAFEKYGKVPVNLYTGSVDMKVPVYNLKINGENSINLFLSYDSSGFIPHKKSDLAGINWSLIGGGRITRTINRIADEYLGNPTAGFGNPFDSGNDLHGFLTGVRKNKSTNVDIYNLNNGSVGNSGIAWYLGPNLDDAYEGEPDVFNFNILGLHGKFMVGNDGKVIVESDDPNIQVDLSGVPSYGKLSQCKPPTSEIILIDSKGNTYYFGGDYSKYEISYASSTRDATIHNDLKGAYYINSWSISKIVFNDGKTVTFDYAQDTLNIAFCINGTRDNLLSNSKILDMESYLTDGSRSGSMKNCPGGFIGCETANGAELLSDGFALIKKSLLESITFGNTIVKINYKDGGYPINHYDPAITTITFNEFLLDNIQIKNNNNIIQTTTFGYTNFGTSDKRPFLTNITESPSNTIYSLEYYNTSNFPAYYTKGIDHWGFWNGMDNNQTLMVKDNTYIPATGDYTLNSTIRDPNIALYNVGLLSKVTYPTKGYTVFEYEAPYYGKRIERNSGSAFLPTLTNNSGYIGGARIKRQYDYSENGGLTNEKEYQYSTTLNGTTSSGILMNWPRYTYYIEWKGTDFFQNLYINNSTNVQQNSLDSYNIGYSKVFEIDKNKGYIEHNFYSYEDYPDPFNSGEPNIKNYMYNGSNYQTYPENLYKNLKNLYGTDRSIMRGKLKKDVIFKEGNTTPIKQVEYEYTDNMDFNPNNQQDNNNYVSVNHLSGYWVQGYKRYFNPTGIKKKVVTDFLNGSSVVSTTDYYYDNNSHLNLTKENNILPDNTVISQNFYYAQDSQGDNYLMRSKNMVGIPVITEIKENNKSISKRETVYPKKTSEITNNSFGLVLPLSKQSTQTNTISATLPPVGEIKDTDITYDQFDNLGNLQQYTTKSGIPTAIIWGYNNTQPIAKIEGATYSQVSSLATTLSTASDTDGALAPMSDESTFLTAVNKFRNDTTLKNYQITTYTYDPLIGIRSITPPDGITDNYKYDITNRLEKILDKENNIVKEFKYNFAHTTFYNEQQSRTFTRNNCGTDNIAGTYTYIVPAKTYTSTISIDDANQKALKEINDNGQDAANNYGICTHVCPLILGNITGISASGGFKEMTPNHFSGNVDITFLEDKRGAVVLGSNGTCAPNSVKTFTQVSGDSTYTLTISPTSIILKAIPGLMSAGTTISFPIEYDK